MLYNKLKVGAIRSNMTNVIQQVRKTIKHFWTCSKTSNMLDHVI